MYVNPWLIFAYIYKCIYIYISICVIWYIYLYAYIITQEKNEEKHSSEGRIIKKRKRKK